MAVNRVVTDIPSGVLSGRPAGTTAVAPPRDRFHGRRGRPPLDPGGPVMDISTPV
ncbi:hypothetical protein AB0G15_26645 [Streptosporangium sp. NPDC023825]|uniref:hypothetical protein n=1 Tax=Streptosporangium sp. NPDC023825 TaxID=3154909 RepID=UPI003412D029